MWFFFFFFLKGAGVRKTTQNDARFLCGRCVRMAPSEGRLTPNHLLYSWHLAAQHLSFFSSFFFLQESLVGLARVSLTTGSVERTAPLGVSPSSSAHGGPRWCGVQMIITPLRCMLRTSLPLLERLRQTLPTKSPRSARFPSLCLSRSIFLSPCSSLYCSVVPSLSLSPPLSPLSLSFPLDPLQPPCHLRTRTASFTIHDLDTPCSSSSTRRTSWKHFL